MKRILALAFALMFTLSGCAEVAKIETKITTDMATVTEKFNAQMDKLAAFSVTDLNYALAEAKSDPRAAQCYSGLIPLVLARQAERDAPKPPTHIPGPFEVLQKIRNVIRGGQSTTIMDQVSMACASFAADVVKDEVKITAQIAAASSGVGAGPAIFQTILPLLKMLMPVKF